MARSLAIQFIAGLSVFYNLLDLVHCTDIEYSSLTGHV